MRGAESLGAKKMYNWIWALNAIDKCRERAYFAKNQKFVDLWHDIADKLEAKYLAGQPRLRTHDGKLQ